LAEKQKCLLTNTHGATVRCFSYVLVRDFGFAPNPFFGVCTLATCKPHVRNRATVGDWVLGCGSAQNGISGYLVYAMQVNEKMHFNEYWSSGRFSHKKPVMNGSLKQMYGDNIYHFEDSTRTWVQEDSHHSYEEGTVNMENLRRDLKSEYVLTSSYYWYFGGDSVLIPDRFKATGQNLCCTRIGHIVLEEEGVIEEFVGWLKGLCAPGYIADPLEFKAFSRYSGR